MQRMPSFLRVGDRAIRVESYSGAEPFAEVVAESGGLLPYAKKHLGALRWADLEASVGIDADPALYQWIGDAWFGHPSREQVVLETPAEAMELEQPTLREVVLPALDVRAHDQRFLKVKIAPQSVRRHPAGGSVVFDGRDPGRELYAHAFTVEIDGIDCSGVQAVAPVAVQAMGELKRGGTLAFSDVHLAVASDKLASFRAWFDDFVLRGNNDDGKERVGRITFYDPMLKDALATLELYHLGIYRVGPVERARTQVDLYCERMELKTFAAL